MAKSSASRSPKTGVEHAQCHVVVSRYTSVSSLRLEKTTKSQSQFDRDISLRSYNRLNVFIRFGSPGGGNPCLIASSEPAKIIAASKRGAECQLNK